MIQPVQLCHLGKLNCALRKYTSLLEHQSLRQSCKAYRYLIVGWKLTLTSTQNKPADDTHGKNSIEAAADKAVGGIKAMKEEAQHSKNSPTKQLPEARCHSLHFSPEDWAWMSIEEPNT